MRRDDLDRLEAFHAGRLAGADAMAWAERLAADPALLAEVAAELRLANALRAAVLIGDGSAAAAAARTRALLRDDRPSRRMRAVRNVLAAMRPPRRRRRWLAAGAVALAAALLLLVLRPAAASAPLAWSGDHALASGAPIPDGELRFADGSRVVIAPGSIARLAGDPQRKRIALDHGALGAEIAPQGADAGFAVATPHGEASVVGTRFTLASDDDGALLRVTAGRVRLQAGGTQRMVAADEAALAFAGTVLPVPPPWPDRRPLARWVVSGARADGAFSPTNPNGWLHDPGLDAASPAFADRVLAETATVASSALRAGAQGVILYGLEGGAVQSSAGFVGDPRRIDELAPELAAVVDRVFARLRADGLAVGVSVTPWRLERGSDRPVQIADPATAEAELGARIAAARARWGCTLFYVNTRSPGIAPGALSDRALRAVAGRHPEVLLVVEEASPGQAVFAAAQVFGADDAPADARATVRLPWLSADPAAALARGRAGGDLIAFDASAPEQVEAVAGR